MRSRKSAESQGIETTKTIDSRSARENWRTVVDEVITGESATVITRHGAPVVALIRYQDFVAIQKQLEDLRAEQQLVALYARYQKEGEPPPTWQETQERLLHEVERIKAKNEPSVPLAEVKRRIAAKQAARVGN